METEEGSKKGSMTDDRAGLGWGSQCQIQDRDQMG